MLLFLGGQRQLRRKEIITEMAYFKHRKTGDPKRFD